MSGAVEGHIDGSDTQRERAVGLFTFLREFVALRSPTVRDLSSYEVLWLDEIPDDTDSATALWSEMLDGEWAWIARVKREPGPVPDESLHDWLLDEKDRPSRTLPKFHTELSDAQGRFTGFNDDPIRKQAYNSFCESWGAWATEDQRREESSRLYSRLFEFARRIEREGEQIELLVAVGCLTWERNGGRIRRHLLATGAQIEMDRDTGRISIGPADEAQGPWLEDDMLDPEDRLPPDEDRSIRSLVGALDDILVPEEIRPILQQMATILAAEGRYVEETRPTAAPGAAVTISFAPALILRPRGDRSLIEAYQQIIGQVENADISPAVGALLEPVEQERRATTNIDEPGDVGSIVDDNFLPLPANEAQLRIIDRLADRRGVVVQGPPGTGKSHTIANLIADLLAKGKRILVTSQTTQALQVLHGKLPRSIAELCVSALGDQRKSQNTLEASVQAILGRRASHDHEENRLLVERLTRERKEIRERLQETYREVVSLREAETQATDFAPGYRGTLSQVGALLAADTGLHDWLPLAPESPDEPPLRDPDAVDFARYLRTLGQADLNRVAAARIDPSDLPDPESFRRWVLDERAIEETVSSEASHQDVETQRLADEARAGHERAVELWPGAAQLRPVGQASIHLLEQRLDLVERLLLSIRRRSSAWLEDAVDGALRGDARRLAERIDAVRGIVAKVTYAEQLAAGRRVTGIDDHAIPSLIEQARALKAHLAAGGRLKNLIGTPGPVKQAQELLAHVRLDGAPPDDLPTLELTIPALEVADATQRAWRTWAVADSQGSLSDLRAELDLADEVIRLQDASRELHAAVTAIPAFAVPNLGTDSGREALRAVFRMVEADAARATFAEDTRTKEAERAARLTAAHRDRAELAARLSSLEVAGCAPECSALADAVKAADVDAYSRAYAANEGLATLAQDVARFYELREALRDGGGAALSKALEDSPDDSAWDERLGGLSRAWRWRVADRRFSAVTDKTHRRQLEARLADADKELQQVTERLAVERAWSYMFQRMSQSEQEHLASYASALRRLGKGTGKRAASIRRDAQQHLDGCQRAIPAWIMPFYRVAQTVTPERDRFDVVIVDEASQAGIESLLLFHLAPKIVVVGDDQQISPENVGVNRDAIADLKRRYLGGIELASELDADTSLFDQASLRFGERIVLKEHFRCMPEIISFSNELCYRELNIPLVPLRQFGADRLEPLTSTFVPSGFRTGSSTSQINEPEADALVDAVARCVDDPRYERSNMGVISLLGKPQARHIEKLLMERLGPSVMLARDIRCGDAYTFQGDERDVMFVSLVATREPGRRLSALTAGSYKRRFNVAASRARDQLWLFHSVMPDDLSPECLRRRLLEHVLHPPPDELASGPDPDGLDDELHRAPFESIFEQRVYRRLRAKGYNVVPQHEVIGYRIDLVVIGERARLAVECDGDAFHGPDRYAADSARQRELERCGWEFFRIPGGTFFRDPDAALADLWPMLERKDIHPAGYVRPPRSVNTTPAAASRSMPEHEPNPSSVPASARPPDPVEESTPSPDEDPSSDHGPQNLPPQLELVADADADVADSIPVSIVEAQSSSPAAPLEVETAPVAQGSPGLLMPYVSFDWANAARTRPFPDPRETTSVLVSQGLQEIIEVEGPIKVSRLYSLYVVAAGRSRVTRSLREQLNRELARLIRNNHIVHDNEIGAPGYLESVVRLPNTPQTLLRQRGPRTLEEIPRREIAAHAAEVRRARGVRGDHVKRVVLTELGLKRMTEAVERYLEEAIELDAAGDSEGS